MVGGEKHRRTFAGNKLDTLIGNFSNEKDCQLYIFRLMAG